MARNIRALRVHYGLSQVVVADLAGISPSVLADIESGVTWNPGLFTIINIARALDTTLSVLLKDEIR